MNKQRFGFLAAAMGLAGLMGGAQATQPLTSPQHNVRSTCELKATKEERKSKEAIKINAYGGLDFNPFLFSDSGIPPHIYGMMHIKSRGGKKFGNRLRFSHNAKLKRRRAQHA